MLSFYLSVLKIEIYSEGKIYFVFLRFKKIKKNFFLLKNIKKDKDTDFCFKLNFHLV